MIDIEANYLFAFLLTVFAGLSTGIGSALAFFTKSTNKVFLSTSLGFSAGVMIYISFVEIMAKSKNIFLEIGENEFTASLYTFLAFIGGIFLILIIDRIVPDVKNPHKPHRVEEISAPIDEKKRMLRIGLFTALAIGIHNFPEGLATFTSALTNPTIGLSIAIAIAIHNIPEGIAVSVPVYYSTGSKSKAFWLSFSSGLAEPIGAVIGFLLLKPFLNEITLSILFGAVAGIMVFISIDELLPSAREFDTGHYSIYGIIGGMIVMGVSLLLFK